jgi:hypothetical protein
VKRRWRQSAEEPGQDSFLDIVANLVGILIILIMIVGAQAKDAMLRVGQPSAEVQEEDLETEKDAVAAVRNDLQRLVDNAKKQAFEISYRHEERDRILTLIAEAERALDEQKQQLSQEQRDAHDLQLQIAAAQRQLDDLKMTHDIAQRSTAPVKVLMHRPTPLAKTVFGREVHFRLKCNRIAYVPLDELVEQFKVEAKQQAWKLRQAPAITETVGPIGDFRLKYTLKKVSYNLHTQAGNAFQERVELDSFVLVPVRDDLGESLDVALQPQSQFRSILSSFNPNEATVTVWVYPDSFDNFRRLKEELFQLGFLTASRPLPDGMPISGSPEGTRSAAQ